MNTVYETDIIAWSEEQAELLRTRRFLELDIARIAEEIEDVGKSERRELASRMAVLLTHLLKWQCQPGRRGSSWQRTIREQRRAIAARINETPSLKASLSDGNWLDGVWADAVAQATEETGLDVFPDACPWPADVVLSQAFLPD